VKIRFAISPGFGPPDLDVFAAMVDRAEALGFDGLWFSDLPIIPSLDPFLAVAFAASRTSRLKLGTNLVPFGYEGFVFARQVAQLDRVTGGRLLVTLVPGLDQPGERAALGIGAAHRGRLLDGRIPQLRGWLAGDAIAPDGETAVALPVLPVQDPLEIWLGGSGPQAVARAGQLADGWLGSLMPPQQAASIRERIDQAATDAGRAIDPEHFGLSIAYARDGDALMFAPRRPTGTRRGDDGPGEPVPVGRDALRSLIARLTDSGMSKFVVRPASTVTAWPDELDWLADTLLDLQT
jgi:probable F420-dependent oxidoreductase